MRVALTRDDRYLLHAERFEIARRLNADLFLSIHADSAGDASEVEGASIYTLSNEASSDAAARFAERENASDRLNGVNLSDQSDTVGTILVELSQRRTWSNRRNSPPDPARSRGRAAFPSPADPLGGAEVLRAPDVPSVCSRGIITTPPRRSGSALQKAQQFAQTMARPSGSISPGSNNRVIGPFLFWRYAESPC